MKYTNFCLGFLCTPTLLTASGDTTRYIIMGSFVVGLARMESVARVAFMAEKVIS